MGRVSCQPNCVGSRLILLARWDWSFGAKGFFPRASERRVLLIVEACHHILSSHLLIFTPSHLHIFSSSQLLTSSHLLISSHIFSSSYLHIFSHLLIFTSSHAHIFTSSHIFSHLLIFTSSHIFSSSHLLTSSHLHIFSHLLLFTSSHTFSSYICSHLLTSSLSCLLALLPSCPLPCPSCLFLS